MVCEKCEKKLGTVITPDTWKDGARNTTESGGRKLNENKALTSKKARFDPYGKNKFAICRICKSSVHQPGSHYCQGCAYKKVSPCPLTMNGSLPSIGKMNCHMNEEVAQMIPQRIALHSGVCAHPEKGGDLASFNRLIAAS
ncbi:cysteine-rich PDZ-binding protein isoform X2 [Strigops habroptila]|uniref:cysteine-rich PDZ-binding protein isoform X2 n=1 Tax=Strigops habroptila TaxID=2489341 RepID=UPI0011CEFE61|nr:cysteine-rich PDZ-binding protein isoform X2 [Strigops habroptila]